MTASSRHDANYLRKRSAHSRELADLMTNADAQAYMRKVADDYERLAIRFEKREAKHAAPSLHLTATDCRTHAQRCREMALHMRDLEDVRQLEVMAEE